MTSGDIYAEFKRQGVTPSTREFVAKSLLENLHPTDRRTVLSI